MGPDPLIDRRLGRYLIHQEIGRGGMARVYRATDTLLQRPVALKILAPQLGNDPDFARRFAREAITAANLRHPAIITIFDIGEIEGLNYIAMEYIAGRSLHEVLVERRKLGLALALAVLAPVAQALQYAHGQGAVHRDVKPHNILLDTNGRVLLTDFGIAIRPAEGNERLTQAGTLVGTPEYLSPEQIQAQPLTGRSDLYSLAVVAFECLAGQVPFEGNISQLLMAHVYSASPAVTSIDPALPRELDPVLARALAKNPDARFAQAVDFVEALRTVAFQYGMPPASHEEIAALALPAGSSAGPTTVAMQTPPVLPPRTASMPQEVPAPPAVGTVQGMPRAETTRAAGRQSPRQLVDPQAEANEGVIPPRRPRYTGERGSGMPWSVAVVGLVALLLIGLLVARSSRRRTLDNVFAAATEVAAVAEATASPATASLAGAMPTTEPIGAPAETPAPMSTATPAPPSATPPAAEASSPATAVSPPLVPPKASGTPQPTVAPGPAVEPSPTLAPGATPSPPPTEAATAATAGPPDAPTPIGGAGSLVFQVGAAINLRDMRGQTGIPLSPSARPLGPAAISPDGQKILFDALEGDKRSIFLFDKASGKREALAPGAGDDYHPSWSPDGLRVIFTSTRDGNPELYVVDVDGKHLERFTNDTADDDYPSFSPDGAQIVWESKHDGRWQIFAMNTDRVRPLVAPAGQSNDRFPRISPDGLHVAFASDRDRPGGLEIYIQELASGRSHRLTNFETGSASGPQWSPDGQQIVFFSDHHGTNDIYTLSVSDGAVQQFSHSPDDERWPSWGP